MLGLSGHVRVIFEPCKNAGSYRVVPVRTGTGAVRMSERKVPFGQLPDGTIVTVEDVARGKACDAACPGCSIPLIAAKGEVVVHHFRHVAENYACTNPGETALHQFAKQVIPRLLHLRLPDYDMGQMISAAIEPRLDGLIPDVLCLYESGESLAVEFWVAHQVPQDKVAAYNARQLAAVEIDLRSYRLAILAKDDWERGVTEKAPRYWLSPPKAIRSQREQARLNWLENQKNHITHLYAEGQTPHAHYEEIKLARAAEKHRDWETKNAQALRLNRITRGPDLQELIATHGGYDKIPPDAWAEYDAEVARWKADLRAGTFWYPPYRTYTEH